jgi:hypothetical protein
MELKLSKTTTSHLKLAARLQQITSNLLQDYNNSLQTCCKTTTNSQAEISFPQNYNKSKFQCITIINSKLPCKTTPSSHHNSPTINSLSNCVLNDSKLDCFPLHCNLLHTLLYRQLLVRIQNDFLDNFLILVQFHRKHVVECEAIW